MGVYDPATTLLFRSSRRRWPSGVTP